MGTESLIARKKRLLFYAIVMHAQSVQKSSIGKDKIFQKGVILMNYRNLCVSSHRLECCCGQRVPWRPMHCNLLGSFSYSTGKRFQQKSNKNADGTHAEDEYSPCRTVLGDLDAGVQARMQVVNQVFKRRIEQFSCQHQATVE